MDMAHREGGTRKLRWSPRRLLGRPGLGLLLVGMMLAGCGNSSSQSSASSNGSPAPQDLAADQTLHVHVFFRPSTFDPGRLPSAASGGNGLGRQYTEALLKPKAGIVNAREVDVTGAAATSYDVSGDGLVYTFHLRDNRFNDGRPVAAQDFVYGWRRVIDPRLAAPFSAVFAGVVKGGSEAAALNPQSDGPRIDTALSGLGLRAVDARTFEVTLAHPAPYFKWIATLQQGAPVREDVVERAGAGWAGKPETLITNGPFKLSGVTQGSITLDANPYYWDKPRLSRIIATFNIDPAPLWAAYLNNELDISNGPPPASRESALNDPRLKKEYLSFLELSNNWLQINAARAPLDNPKVRLAFAESIDRKAFLGVASNAGKVLTTLLPDGIPGYDRALGGPQNFDVSGARATLAASGVDPARFGDVKILTAPFQQPDAVFLADQIKKNLGITLPIETVGDTATMNNRVRQGDFYLKTTFQGYSALYPDPQDFFDVFLSNNPQNPSRWFDPEYDRLVKQADSTPEIGARLPIYDQAEKLLVTGAPVVFLSQLDREFWVKSWVRGIARTPVDTAFMPGDFYTTKIWIAKH